MLHSFSYKDVSQLKLTMLHLIIHLCELVNAFSCINRNRKPILRATLMIIFAYSFESHKIKTENVFILEVQIRCGNSVQFEFISKNIVNVSITLIYLLLLKYLSGVVFIHLGRVQGISLRISKLVLTHSLVFIYFIFGLRSVTFIPKLQKKH